MLPINCNTNIILKVTRSITRNPLKWLTPQIGNPREPVLTYTHVHIANTHALAMRNAFGECIWGMKTSTLYAIFECTINAKFYTYQIGKKPILLKKYVRKMYAIYQVRNNDVQLYLCTHQLCQRFSSWTIRLLVSKKFKIKALNIIYRLLN